MLKQLVSLTSKSCSVVFCPKPEERFYHRRSIYTARLVCSVASQRLGTCIESKSTLSRMERGIETEVLPLREKIIKVQTEGLV